MKSLTSKVLNYPKEHNYILDDVKLEIMFIILICEARIEGSPDTILGPDK